MHISRQISLYILVTLQILIFGDVILSLAGRTSFLTDYAQLNSLVILLLCPAVATVFCAVLFLRVHSGSSFSRWVKIVAFLVFQFATMAWLYQTMAMRSFNEAKNTALSFLRTSSPKGLFAEGISESDLFALRGKKVDLIPFQSLKRYKSYEFLVKPPNRPPFIVQLRGNMNFQQIFVFVADENLLRLPRSGTLEDFEKPTFNVDI